jgi:hypothetical protein
VGYVIKKHKYAIVQRDLSPRGRPSLLNRGDMELILSKVKNEPKISSKKLAIILAKKVVKRFQIEL